MNTLRKNTEGSAVLFLQKKLKPLFPTLNPDGKFGHETHTIVKQFQAQNNLPADGIVGGKTWIALYLKTVNPRDTTGKTDRFNNILHLHPTMRLAAVKTVFQLQSEGIPFRIHCAFRYPEAQAELYAQGRTTPGNIVTYAKPWQSYHQYGLAADFVPIENGLWVWKNTGIYAQWWNRLHEVAAKWGLEKLGFETPHLQLKGLSIQNLIQGNYPPNGDLTWAQNLQTAIHEWSI